MFNAARSRFSKNVLNRYSHCKALPTSQQTVSTILATHPSTNAHARLQASSYHVGRSWPSSDPSLPVSKNKSPTQPSFSDVLETVLSTPNTSTFNSLGVIRTEKSEDIRLMIQNYTSPSLATALRDREDTLQLAASLLASNSLPELRDLLSPHESRFIQKRRKRRIHMSLSRGFSPSSLEMLRKYLARMPRQVTKAHRHRASVVLPLCDLEGVPSVLFEKRSMNLNKHPGEICFPGGMVSEGDDTTIVSTCLREMSEETGLPPSRTVILGILRCNWSEVMGITGIAVTPVVGYLGELDGVDMEPNKDEVEECFTVPLSAILEKSNWVYRDDAAPVFTGGPHVIWGLTAYILDRFMKDVLARYRITLDDGQNNEEKEEEEKENKYKGRDLSSWSDEHNTF
ncbi:hypothetical protein TrST_g13789 [Triparma strigata]|uniref:Nudix hydrolase domain-containing protein n=1 Tax=Triparma strigata TaxID=1606541 RepID=A0A9W7AMD9_9STRA|nr:hypothetical protein TrST_g13789 [Triparma strigata]